MSFVDRTFCLQIIDSCLLRFVIIYFYVHFGNGQLKKKPLNFIRTHKNLKLFQF